jgi:hypothetical protein
VNVPGRTTKPARRIQVKRPERRLYERGTFSNTISVYRDCRTGVDPDVPDVPDLLGVGFFVLLRSDSGLWIRARVTVGVREAPGFGESLMVISVLVIVIESGRGGGGEEGGVSSLAADIGATA